MTDRVVSNTRVILKLVWLWVMVVVGIGLIVSGMLGFKMHRDGMPLPWWGLIFLGLLTLLRMVLRSMDMLLGPPNKPPR